MDTPGRVEITEITPPDLPALAAFLQRHRRPGDVPAPPPLPPEQRLRWLLLDNPARAADIPLGWIMRDPANQIVGAICCVPLTIGAGAYTTTALMSCNF